MGLIESRAFSGESDLALLVDFARQATAARWPRPTYWHAGDVTWQLYAYTGLPRVGDVRLWFENEQLLAFAIFEPPLNLRFDIRPGRAVDGPILTDILTWGESRWRRHRSAAPPPIPIAYAMLGEDARATVSLESDADRITALSARGFVPVERHSIFYRRDMAAPVEPPALPDGYAVRHATAADIPERAELHRDAWSVWGPSTFSVERYERLRATPLYDEELDVVVQAPDGRLVSSCLCWMDDQNGVGTFEPVGTRPSAAGKGLARAAILEALTRLRARGAHTALVSTASVNERALAFYPSCGFQSEDIERYFVRPVNAAPSL